MPNGPDNKLHDLKWNLEEFATKDPFDVSRANKIADNIKKYTSHLIQFVLKILESPTDILGSRLVVKLSDHWTGSSLLRQTSDGTNIVPLMQWECLEEVESWPSEYRPLAVTVVRSTACLNFESGETQQPVLSVKSVRVLALSARPFGDNDVPHRLVTRTIYQVVQSLETQQYPPELIIARPGSIESLDRELGSHPTGYFDIVHLDVHGEADEDSATLLFLENAEPTNVKRVEAYQLGKVLRNHGVRCVIMNACQSAALVHNFTRSLVQEGIPMVLGMQYKLLETAAEILTTTLYEGLLARNQSLPDACAYARSKLRAIPSRRTNYNTTVRVLDYMNPVLFMAERFEEPDLREIGNAPQVAANAFEVEQGLLGRESVMLDMENDFLTFSNLGFLTGIAGSGKSALAAHLSWWWKATGLICGTLHIDFASFGSLEWKDIVQLFCDEVRQLKIDHQDVNSEEKLLQHLQHYRYLVLFDSIDALGSVAPIQLLDSIIKFSKTLKKRYKKSKVGSLILFVSRDEQNRLRADTAAQVFPLQGLVRFLG
ncbi:hypothetical protein BT63DRAFT_423766 [Microthyrium microscopicum]|uniref:CHAT domain-containing protein n=1 Tax=Microthyrium microscopicum TaxID=703497 RepID=A0A6A6UD37_9PEZI|nr:hypothetical protein BT63DRAFT_423766 [Microthyrium microscopicum]